MINIDAESVLLLQPHADDAALSVAPAFLDGTLDPSIVTLVTLFSSTDFIPYANQKNFVGKNVTAVRIEEDRQFAAAMGFAAFIPLNAADGLKREGRITSNPEQDLEDSYIDSLYNLLAEAVDGKRVGSILASLPSGEKQHIDHRYTAAVARKLSIVTQSQVLWYDDLPYSSITTQDASNHGLEIFASIPLLADTSESQRRLANLYASQMGDHFIRPLIAKQQTLGAAVRLFCTKT